ncbi:MAG: hypothetical protein H0V27_02735, partial [Pyrinomonadaceae bacterium]|nr:hypothetical protein [Pyrinomonadaceae bacterium]
MNSITKESPAMEAVTGRAGGADDYQIAFTLKPAGAQKFGQWTAANINQYMGVV